MTHSKKMFTVVAEDIVVGSIAEYRDKCRKANDPVYRAAVLAAERRPKTLREVLGMTASLPMREVLFPTPA